MSTLAVEPQRHRAFRKNFYSQAYQFDDSEKFTFVEGPFQNKKYVVHNSSSISTTEIDQFRQGVEMTQEKHNLGMAKMSAGTAGHIIRPLQIGDEQLNITGDNYYRDLEYFDPVKYLAAMAQGLDLSKVFTFPICLPNSERSDNFSMNGIIEPLTIRAVASFFSIDFPFESHAFRGTLMDGNTDIFYGSSDRIVSIDYVQKKVNKPKEYIDGAFYYKSENRSFVNDDWFLEAFEYFDASAEEAIQTVAYFDSKLNKLDPFDDSTVYFINMGVTESTHGADMVQALSSMNIFEENYVSYKQRSAPTGFVYENIASVGVDSVAFGGMVH